MSRDAIAAAQRVVVKVGSSSLTSRGRLDPARLGALVDALVLLSDVDGLYTSEPRRAGARALTDVQSLDELAQVRLRGGGSGVGTGGMATKIEAATIARLTINTTAAPDKACSPSRPWRSIARNTGPDWIPDACSQTR